MCDSQGCCHGSAGLGLGSVPADVASGSAKTIGTLVAAKLAAGLLAVVLAAAAAVIRAVVPVLVLAVAAALAASGALLAVKLRRTGLALVTIHVPPPGLSDAYKLPGSESSRTLEGSHNRLAIDSRHVIPAWQDYETTEIRR